MTASEDSQSVEPAPEETPTSETPEGWPLLQSHPGAIYRADSRRLPAVDGDCPGAGRGCAGRTQATGEIVMKMLDASGNLAPAGAR